MDRVVERSFWRRRIEDSWQSRSIVWLSGARRLGKTILGRGLPEVRYFNCDLPEVRARLSDPVAFLRGFPDGSRMVLDEIHRAEDPSEILKIAADEFPGLRLLATGSSSLSAGGRFRDALTGRKWTVPLTPVLWRECPDWLDAADLDRRLLHGGFPDRLLAAGPHPEWFEEWLDSFFARDIQALFSVRNRGGFLRLVSLTLAHHGGLPDASSLARDAGITRPTALAWLDLLDLCGFTVRVPPFHGGGKREIVRRPRLYALDSGLVCHARGWNALRPADRGVLWEGLVLDELRAAAPRSGIRYWRDREGREVDFVLPAGRGRVAAVEAEISPDAFSPRALRVFREAYPDGPDLLCCPFVEAPYRRRFGSREVTVCEPRQIPALLRAEPSA